jgi:hypothetical protein
MRYHFTECATAHLAAHLGDKLVFIPDEVAEEPSRWLGKLFPAIPEIDGWPDRDELMTIISSSASRKPDAPDDLTVMEWL